MREVAGENGVPKTTLIMMYIRRFAFVTYILAICCLVMHLNITRSHVEIGQQAYHHIKNFSFFN